MPKEPHHPGPCEAVGAGWQVRQDLGLVAQQLGHAEQGPGEAEVRGRQLLPHTREFSPALGSNLQTSDQPLWKGPGAQDKAWEVLPYWEARFSSACTYGAPVVWVPEKPRQARCCAQLGNSLCTNGRTSGPGRGC